MLLKQTLIPALALCLCISLPLSGQPVQAAAPGNTAKPVAINEPKKTQADKAEPKPAAKPKKSSLLEEKPVIDEVLQKEIQTLGEKLDPKTRSTMNQYSEAISEQNRIINNELRDNEAETMANIGMLWAAAIEHNGTIRFTIEKLSRRDATGKPVANDTFSRRMAQSLIHLGGVAGTMWTGTPAGMIGSNMVSNALSSNPQEAMMNRVTDADMVLLAKEVDALQTRLITLYYNYRHAQERLALCRDASSVVSKYYDHAAKTPDRTNASLQPLMQSMEESVQREEENAEHSLQSARSELVMLVGEDAVQAIDKKQESGEKQS